MATNSTPPPEEVTQADVNSSFSSWQSAKDSLDENQVLKAFSFLLHTDLFESGETKSSVAEKKHLYERLKCRREFYVKYTNAFDVLESRRIATVDNKEGFTNDFDFLGGEELFVSNKFGALQENPNKSKKFIPEDDPNAEAKGRLDKVELIDLGVLKDAQFKTEEAESRYYWSKGNTYTFGGGCDYGYANSYEVNFSYDAIVESSFECWDGMLPYDIYRPKDGSIKLDVSGRPTSFDKLPDAYKVHAAIPPGSLFFRQPSSDIELANNGVGKNVGHTYGYQLGDTYSIQLSQNSHEITAVDMQHSFESTLVSESHSWVGLSANFDAHGADFNFGIKAIDYTTNLTGMRASTDHVLFDFSYEKILRKFEYTDAGKIYKAADAVEFRMSDQDIKTVTSKRVNTVATKGIVLQVDADEAVGKIPGDVLGRDPTWKNTFVDAIPYLAWYRAWRMGDSSEKAFDEHVVKTDSNTSRKNIKPEVVSNYTRLDLDPVAASLVSYEKTTNVLSELVLNPEMRIVEFSIRKDSKVYDQINNFTQHFGLDKGLFITSYYGATKDTFGRIWFTQTEGKVNCADAGLEEFTAGIEIQKADKNYASLNLNTGKNIITLHTQKDDKSPVCVKLDSAGKTFVVEAEAGAHKSSFNIDAGKGTGKWHAKNGSKEFDFSYAAGKSAKLTVKGSKTSTIDIASATITLKTDTKLTLEAGSKIEITKTKIKIDAKSEVDINGSKFKKNEMTAAKPKITLGTVGKLVINGGVADLNAPTVKISGKAMTTIAGGMVKLG